MLLQITRHVILKENHPPLPKWLFHRDNVILSQRIQLEESNMKELLIFLDHYSEDFYFDVITVSVVEFEDILLEY